MVNSGKADNKVIGTRKKIIRNFLRTYRVNRFEKLPDYIEVKKINKNKELNTNKEEIISNRSWAEIQETGITLKELHECMCSKNTKSRLLDTNLSEATIRNYIVEMGYIVGDGGYVVKSMSNDKADSYYRIHYSLKKNDYINTYVTYSDKYEAFDNTYTEEDGTKPAKSSIQEDTYFLSDYEEGSINREYCFVIEFEHPVLMHNFAEEICLIYPKSITGLTVGYGMVRIYTDKIKNLIKFENLLIKAKDFV